MFRVMNVMGLNYPPKISAFSFNSEFNTLMNDKVMKNKVEDPIAETAGRRGDEVWIKVDKCAVDK